jgi:glycine/sarcosine N-methyltransferase
MTTDPYQDFAERYDLSFGQFGEGEPQGIEFFRNLFSRNGVRTVLDCACGTGRHLPLFHSLGREVVGSDISEGMLTQARKNLAEHNLNLSLRQVDFRGLPNHFERQFDAVVCLAAIGFMPDEAECLKALKSMFAVLREGGLLVLTAMPTDRQWKERPRYQLVANTRDFTRLFVVDYEERTARYNILDVFHSEARNELEEWSAELRVFLQDEQERLLRASGFRSLEFYGSFDFAPYDKETSNRLISIAYK